MVNAAVRLFYSYAHEDEELRDELQGHLKILERKQLIAPWHDRRIDPGQAWDAEIDVHLRDAELVLLLVSADFIASDYIMGKELATAMAQQRAGKTTVVWVKLRPLDLQPDDDDVAPFLKLQGLPPDLRPVTSWPQRDEAWVLVAQGLRKTVDAIRAARASSPSETARVSQVYISYAHQDRDAAWRLADALGAMGIEARGVHQDLLAGRDFSHAIEHEIRAAPLVIALWSQASMHSDWVRREAGLARDDGKLLPVRIEPVQLPLGFDHIQTLDLIDWDGHSPSPTLQRIADAARPLEARFSRVPPAAARRPSPPARSGLGAGLRDWWQRRRETPSPVAPRPAEAAPDPSLDHLLTRVRAPLVAAARERHQAEPDPSQLDRDAQWLIDRPGATPRILWVDDRPEGNRHERAALARLQIEVVCVRGGDEALALLRPGAAPFDLVISDWHRGAEGPDAALSLLRRLRDHGSNLPVVIYHAEFDPKARATRRERALATGAFGEAVLPQELVGLVVAALRGSAAASI